jgi:hypothetical protein
VPKGQIVEQYTLPKRKVRAKIRIKPAALRLTAPANFIAEGMNCRNVK